MPVYALCYILSTCLHHFVPSNIKLPYASIELQVELVSLASQVIYLKTVPIYPTVSVLPQDPIRLVAGKATCGGGTNI